MFIKAMRSRVDETLRKTQVFINRYKPCLFILKNFKGSSLKICNMPEFQLVASTASMLEESQNEYIEEPNLQNGTQFYCTKPQFD